MPAPIQFYYDTFSPYGYCAATVIEDIAAKYDRTVDWRVVNLEAVAVAAGLTKPLVVMPVKGEYVKRDVPRTLRLFGRAWNPCNLMDYRRETPRRVLHWAAETDMTKVGALSIAVYDALMSKATDLGAPEDMADIAAAHGYDRAQALAEATSEDREAKTKASTKAAIESGVFGVPYTVVDGEPFWGADRLWMVERWLQGGW